MKSQVPTFKDALTARAPSGRRTAVADEDVASSGVAWAMTGQSMRRQVDGSVNFGNDFRMSKGTRVQ